MYIQPVNTFSLQHEESVPVRHQLSVAMLQCNEVIEKKKIKKKSRTNVFQRKFEYFGFCERQQLDVERAPLQHHTKPTPVS